MHRFIFFILLISVATACRRLPNVQGNGEAFMQGVWNQDSISNSDRLLTYTQHKLKITCDSFYVDLTTHSKVNYHEDSCFNNGLWKEYAKGVYAVRQDSLFLEGTYTWSNYKQKISGCYHIGRYIKTFLIREQTDNSLTLLSLSNQRETKLILKEKIICVPKEL